MDRVHRPGTRPGPGQRAGLLASALLILAGALVAVPATPTVEAAVRDPFDAIYASEQNGAIALIGNSQMSCPTSASGCATARTASPLTSGSNEAINNNGYTQAFLDTDTVSTTTNSTSADLALPAGSTVLHARLVWGGRRTAGTGGAAAGTTYNQVKVRTPGQTAYSTVTATTTVAPNLTGNDALPYQASLDVTSLVQAAGNGTYWIADLQAATGADRYGGWSLIVAYRNPSLPLRNLAIFEGFADVTTTGGNNSVSVPISGFLTPATGVVNASVGFVTWEGDRGLTGEAARLNGVLLSDAARPQTNFFNSGITDAGGNVTARNPGFANAFGVDIARVVANGVLPNGATSTTLALSTTEEFFYPGVITTQIDLYTPAFNPISKTVTNLNGNDPARAGDTLQYELKFQNTGADFADNVVVTDPLPANVTYVPGTISVVASPGNVNNGTKTDATDTDIGEYVAGTRTVRVRVGTGATGTVGGTLAPNDSVTLRFRVTVDRAASGTTLSNGALLNYRGRTIARDYTYTGNVVSTPVVSLANVSVAKTSVPATQVAGRTVQYPVVVTNNGPNAATGVTLVDTLPAGLTYVSASTPPGASCSAAGQAVTCTLGTISAGATATVTITATIPAGTAAGGYVNTARVSSTTSDDVPADDSASATTQVTTSADLVATKTVPAGQVFAGSEVSYSVGVRNDGPSNASAVRLTDQLPAGTSFVSVASATGTCTAPAVGTGGTVQCAVATLAPGASLTATLTVRVGTGYTGTSVANAATASSSTSDPTSADNSATVTSSVARRADVGVTKAVAPASVAAGGAVRYTLNVTNAGPSDATDVVVTDPAVTGLVPTGANATLGSCTIAAGAVTCDIGTLNPGATTVITIDARVDQAQTAGALANTATVTTTAPQANAGNDSATATLRVTTSADVSIVKTGPGSFTGGTQGTYSVQAANAGPSQASGVAITDVLPTGLTFVSSPDGCTATGQTVTCPVGTVAAGTSATRSFVVQAAGNIGGTVVNTATVSSSTADPSTANNSSTFTSSAAGVADVAVTKAIAPATLVAGGAATFTIDVRNNGPSTAQGVTLSDPVPPGFAVTSVTPAPECTTAVACSFGDLAAGATRTVTITGTLSPNVANGTRLTNTAIAASTGPVDPTSSNNSATASGIVTTSADMGIVLSVVSPGPYAAGSLVDYVAVVTNNGPSTARGVVASGQVPDGLVPVLGSSGGLCVVTGQTVSCNLGDFPPGASVRIPLQARIRPDFPPGPIPANALVGSSTPDANPANDESSTTIPVVAAADLVTTKSVPSPLIAGAESTYTITVSNGGPSDAIGVSITDTLPGELTPLSTSPSSGTCSSTGQTVTCSIDRLPAGTAVTVELRVRVGTGAGAFVTNTASASSSTPDPGPGANAVTTTTPVTQAADLTVTKTASPIPAAAGASISYDITVSNAGPSNAADVTIGEQLPAGLTILPAGIATDPGVTCTPNGDRTALACSFGTIPAGQSRTVTVETSIPEDRADGSTITNTVTVASPTPPLTPGSRTAVVDTAIFTEADLVVVKEPLDEGVVAGDPHGYLISVRNEGPSLARGIVLSDQLPPGTTFVSAVPSTGTCATPAGSTLECQLGDVSRGEIVTVQLTVLLGPDLGETVLVNSASATSSTPDPATANNASTVDQLVTRRADLLLTKAITSGPIVAGSDVTYRMAVTNDGPSDTLDATIDDPIPARTTLVTATPEGDGTCAVLPPTPPGTAPIVRCTWPTLLDGETRSVDLTFAVPADTPPGTAIANTATARSVAIDPTPNDVTVTDPTASSADVSVTKSLISGTPIAGGLVRWQVVVRNSGPSVAPGTGIVDAAAPDGVTFTEVTSTAGTCTVATDLLGCELGTLEVGGTATVTIIGRLDPGFAAPSLINTVGAGSDAPDPDPSNNSATSTTPVATSADVSVTKTTGPGELVAGSTATWTLTVANAGPSAASSVTVDDSIPVGVVEVTATSSTGAACDVTSAVSCPLGTLAVDATATVTITGTITADYLAGDVTNTAEVTTGTPDPDPTNDTAEVTSDVGTSADLGIAKSAPGSAAPGQQVTWNVTITNDGPSVARGVVVTDELPVELLNPTASSAGSVCPIDAGVVRCELGALAVFDGTPDTAAVVTITGTIDPSASTATLTNVAVVDAATSDPDPTNDEATVSTSLNPSADLSVAKAVEVAPVVPGEPVSWTIDVANAGPSTATSVVVTDDVPTGVDVRGAEIVRGGARSPCTVSGQTVTCSLGAVTPGESVRIVLTGAVDAAFTDPELVNTATLASATPDPTPDDREATSTSPVEPNADVSITKSVDLSGGLPVAGGPVTFLLEVTNLGPSAAQAVQVLDVLPPSIDPATVTVTAPCAFLAATGEVTCALGTLAPDDVVQVAVSATLAPDADDVSNTATVSSSTPDAGLLNNSSTATAISDQLADVGVTKVAPGTVLAGQQIEWTLLVDNQGPSVATGVSVTDVIPAGLVDLVVPTGCTVTDVVTCTVGTLAVGASSSLAITATVPSSSTAPQLDNVVVVAATTPDPVGANGTASTATIVERAAALRVEKVADPVPFVPGRAATYTVTVTNGGPSDAVATLAQDELAPGLIPNGDPIASQGTCEYTGLVLGCDLGVLAADVSATVTIPVLVDPAIDATSLPNTATASSLTPPLPGAPPGQALITTPVSALADLTVTKVAPETVVAGDRIAWQVLVDNAGPSVAPDVVVTDDLPPGTGPVQIVPSQGTCARLGDTITCQLGALSPAATATVDISGTLAADSTVTTLTNIAGVTSPAAEPEPTAPDGRSTSTTTDVATSADVAISKRAEVDPAVPGQPVEWTVTVLNAGPSVARDVVVTDLLPPGVTAVDLTGPAGVTCDDTTGECVVGDLAPGPDAAVEITVTAELAAEAPSDPLTNAATVSSSTPDADPGDNDVTAGVNVEASADLSITKSAAPDPAVRGAPITWTLTVANDGPSVARDVVVADVVPGGTTGASATATQGTCTVEVVCTLGDVASGASVTITISATVAADLAVAQLVNIASVLSSTTDPDAADTTVTITTPVTSSADLEVTKAGPATAAAGTAVAWTVTVTNRGPSVATGVVVTDVLPAGLLDVVLPAGCTPGTPISCAVGTLAVDATATIELSARIDPAATVTTLTNTATATSPSDPDPSDNRASTTTAVTRSADLDVDKSVEPFAVVPGQPATFTLTVTNAGPSTGLDTLVTDTVPEGMAIGAVTSTQGSCAVDDQLVSCALGGVAPNGTVTITIPVDVSPSFDPDGGWGNTASVGSGTTDPDLTNNQDTVSGGVLAEADLSVAKVADVDVVEPTATVTWTVTVANAGPSDAADVTVVDTLPTGISDVTVVVDGDGSCDPVEGQLLACTFDVLAAEASATLTVTATVDAVTGELVNGASVSSTQGTDPDAADNSAQVTTPIIGGPADLSVVKAPTAGGTVAGGPVTWTITVANAGPGPSEGVVVADTLPAAVTSPAATSSAGSCTVTSTAGAAVVGCQLGTIAAGASSTVTVTGTIAPSFRGSLTNLATVSSTTEDGTLSNNSGSATSAVAGVADLRVAKTASRSNGAIGETATFRIEATNAGPSNATGATVVEVLPVGLTFVAARPAVGTYDEATSTWRIGALAAGTSVRLEVEVRLATAGVQTNRVTIAHDAANATEARPEDDVATATITVARPITPTTPTTPTSPSRPLTPLTPSGPIASTGAETWVLTRLAMVALIAGLALVLTARRRRLG